MYPWYVRLAVLAALLLPFAVYCYRNRAKLLGTCGWCGGFVGPFQDPDEFFCSDWCFDACATLCPPVDYRQPEPVA